MIDNIDNEKELEIIGLDDEEDIINEALEKKDENDGFFLEETESVKLADEKSENYNSINQDDVEDDNFEEIPTANAVDNRSKKLKILIGNGRPGLGKSTVAMQLIAPYIFMKNGNNKIPLYTLETDSDSNVSSTYILDAISIEVKENTFDNSMIRLLTKDEHAIYDIGGGKSTQIVMDALVNTGLIYGIDLFVIPLTDGRHEARKTKEFYDFIKANHKNANIVFVLNKVASNACYDDVCLQYIDFLGDRNFMVDAIVGIIEDIEKQDRNLVYLHNDDIIKYSIREEKTVFEIAFTDTTKSDILLKEAILNNENSKIKFLSAKKNNISKAKNYYETSIEPSIKKFDDLLGL